MMSDRHCSRCGGTGKVTRGRVINGVCYKCGGDGKHHASAYAHPSRGSRVVEFVAVDAQGHHLALNQDRAILERIAPSLAGYDHIEIK